MVICLNSKNRLNISNKSFSLMWMNDLKWFQQHDKTKIIHFSCIIHITTGFSVKVLKFNAKFSWLKKITKIMFKQCDFPSYIYCIEEHNISAFNFFFHQHQTFTWLFCCINLCFILYVFRKHDCREIRLEFIFFLWNVFFWWKFTHK